LRMDSVCWAPDNGSKCCTLCATAFTVIVRRHHCRFCGNLMCQNCSNDQICNRLSHSSLPERICKVCKVLLAGHFISLLCLCSFQYNAGVWNKRAWAYWAGKTPSAQARWD
jgi:hypothetical protein